MGKLLFALAVLHGLAMGALLLGDVALARQCQKRWSKKTGLRDVVIEQNQLSHGQVTSLLECARSCHALTACQSFFHAPPSSCHLHRDIFLPSDNVPRLTRPGARYLAVEGVVSCGQPAGVANAFVSHTGVTPGSVATYRCLHPDATFFGNARRHCTTSGVWDGASGACHITRWHKATEAWTVVAIPLPVTPVPVGFRLHVTGHIGSFSQFELQLMNNLTRSTPFYMVRRQPIYFDEYVGGVWQYATHSIPPGFPLAPNTAFDISVTVLASGFLVSVNNVWQYTVGNIQTSTTDLKLIGMAVDSSGTVDLVEIFYF